MLRQEWTVVLRVYRMTSRVQTAGLKSLTTCCCTVAPVVARAVCMRVHVIGDLVFVYNRLARVQFRIGLPAITGNKVTEFFPESARALILRQLL